MQGVAAWVAAREAEGPPAPSLQVVTKGQAQPNRSYAGRNLAIEVHDCHVGHLDRKVRNNPADFAGPFVGDAAGPGKDGPQFPDSDRVDYMPASQHTIDINHDTRPDRREVRGRRVKGDDP